MTNLQVQMYTWIGYIAVMRVLQDHVRGGSYESYEDSSSLQPVLIMRRRETDPFSRSVQGLPVQEGSATWHTLPAKEIMSEKLPCYTQLGAQSLFR